MAHCISIKKLRFTVHLLKQSVRLIYFLLSKYVYESRLTDGEPGSDPGGACVLMRRPPLRDRSPIKKPASAGFCLSFSGSVCSAEISQCLLCRLRCMGQKLLAETCIPCVASTGYRGGFRAASSTLVLFGAVRFRAAQNDRHSTEQVMCFPLSPSAPFFLPLKAKPPAASQRGVSQ